MLNKLFNFVKTIFQVIEFNQMTERNRFHYLSVVQSTEIAFVKFYELCIIA